MRLKKGFYKPIDRADHRDQREVLYLKRGVREMGTGIRKNFKELLHIRDDAVSLGSVNEAHGRKNIPLDQIDKMHCVHSIVPKGSFVSG